MVSTGLEDLDKILAGTGFPDRSTVLIEGPAGMGKEALGYWFMERGLSHGERCIYVTRLAASEVKQDLGASAVQAKGSPCGWPPREES